MIPILQSLCPATVSPHILTNSGHCHLELVMSGGGCGSNLARNSVSGNYNTGGGSLISQFWPHYVGQAVNSDPLACPHVPPRPAQNPAVYSCLLTCLLGEVTFIDIAQIPRLSVSRLQLSGFGVHKCVYPGLNLHLSPRSLLIKLFLAGDSMYKQTKCEPL